MDKELPEMDGYDMAVLLNLQLTVAALCAVVHNTSVIAECCEKQLKELQQINRRVK